MKSKISTNSVNVETRNENKDFKLSYQKTKKIYQELECRRAKRYDSSSREVQILVDKYMHHLSDKHNYNLDAFRELSNFYATDQKMIAYLDTYGDGFSQFLSSAIKHYCS